MEVLTVGSILFVFVRRRLKRELRQSEMYAGAMRPSAMEPPKGYASEEYEINTLNRSLSHPDGLSEVASAYSEDKRVSMKST